jgi:hypothetical protein
LEASRPWALTGISFISLKKETFKVDERLYTIVDSLYTI